MATITSPLDPTIEEKGSSPPRESPLGLAFSVLVFAELFRAFAARSTTRLFWEVGAFTNIRLVASGRRIGVAAARHSPSPVGSSSI